MLCSFPTIKINKNHKLKIIFKWAKDLNRRFTKGDIGMSNEHMQRCQTSLVIMEIQSKTTVRHHFTRVAVTKKTCKSICW